MASSEEMARAESNLTTFLDIKKLNTTLRVVELALAEKNAEVKKLKDRQAVLIMEIRSRIDGEEPLLPL